MKILSFIFLIVLFSSCFNKPVETTKTTVVVNSEWGKYFQQKEIDGTFVLRKLNSDTLTVFNSKRSKQQYLPASTFKILNSLISLETNVIENENITIEWDGKKRFYDKWNQDQNMRTAMKYSCVWFYQELARRIGHEKMQYFIDTVHYGNRKLGAKIDNFWLEGDLRISASEQIDFLEKLLKYDLPFSNSNIETVKSIMLIDSAYTYKYYAKAGWASKIGWYVGFVICEKEKWMFALNIDINDKGDAKLRKIIAEEILRNERIIK
ncbi:MAG: class D beta-lactamase [Ignavibacteriae bacterium]|nr:class D beta-lactamase [Ignavibacteriota bacterium]